MWLLSSQGPSKELVLKIKNIEWWPRYWPRKDSSSWFIKARGRENLFRFVKIWYGWSWVVDGGRFSTLKMLFIYIYIYGFDHMRPIWLDMLRRINWELNRRANTWIRPAKIEKLPFAVSFFSEIEIGRWQTKNAISTQLIQIDNTLLGV